MAKKVTQEHLILSNTNSFKSQGHTSNYNNQIFIYRKFYFCIKPFNI